MRRVRVVEVLGVVGVLLGALAGAVAVWRPGPDDVPAGVAETSPATSASAPGTLAGTGTHAPTVPPTAAAPSSALRGDVLGIDGRPVVGAHVTVTALATAFDAEADDGERARLPPTATTDLAGRFAFPGLATGPYAVTARAAGAGVATVPLVHVAPAGDTTLTLRLAPGTTLAGRVVDGSGVAIAGARVAVDAAAPIRRLYLTVYEQRLEGRRERAVTSGADGGFVFADLERGVYDVEVAAPGFATQTVRAVAAPADGLVVTLARGMTITGVVTVAAAAMPTTVHVTTDPPTSARSIPLVGREAAFVLDGLVPRAYVVRASAVGCTEASERVSPDAREVEAPVRLALVGGTPVVGVVRRPDGTPVPDAAVALAFVRRANLGYSSAVERTVRTDGHGGFEALLRPGEWLASASKAGFAAPEAAERPPVVVGAEPVTIDLVLVPAPVIEGVVRHPDGTPVVGASVSIVGMGTNPDATTSGPVGVTVGGDDGAECDASGRFRLEGVATYGRYTLRARGPGGATATAEGVVFEAGASVAHVAITLERVAETGAHVAGSVVDERGAPVAGAIVVFAGRSSVTAADGTFAREQVPQGTYRARFGAVGYAMGLSAPFAVPARETVRLPAFTVRGRGVGVRGIVRTGTNRPVPDATVTVWFPVDGDFAVLTTATRGDGSYVCDGPALDDGEVVVQVRADGLQFGEQRRTLPMDGPVDFTLAGFATATATITFEGPVAHVEVCRVAAGPDAPTWPVSAAWDASDGSLRVTSIVPGRCRLRVTASGYAPRLTAPFDAREGETIPLGALRMTRGGTVVGRVRDADGRPVANTQVGIDDPFLQVDTDGEGRFRLEHVPAGTWPVYVNVEVPSGRPLPTFDVAVTEGLTTEVDERLGR